MALLLGIDLGTSYFKVGLFDECGVLKGLGRVRVDKATPAPDRCELAVETFWHLLRSALAEALAQAGATAGDIAGLSYSSQASTFLLLDANDVPLTPLIVWTDQRGAPVAVELEAFARTEAFRCTTGSEGLSEQSAPTKWRWFQRNEPGLWARTRRIMTLADYVTFSLTGERAIDTSTAAFLGVLDLERGGWWPESLAAFGIDEEKLPIPLRPGAPCGRTIARALELLGVPAGIPFAVGALDHHVAAIGSGLERLAEVSISTGTVLAALTIVDAPVPQRGCYHGCHVDGARFWRLAFDPNGAVQLEEYQRVAGRGHSIEELLAFAGHAPAGVGWQSPAKQDHGTAVRGVLERVAATHRGLLRYVTRTAGKPITVNRVVATGGGARSPLWLQITANVLDLPVVTPACPERACLGAAAFAAVAAGCYASIAEATGVMVRPERVYEPEPAAVAFYRELAQ